jgi:uncharacterized membrane protein
MRGGGVRTNELEQDLAQAVDEHQEEQKLDDLIELFSAAQLASVTEAVRVEHEK